MAFAIAAAAIAAALDAPAAATAPFVIMSSSLALLKLHFFTYNPLTERGYTFTRLKNLEFRNILNIHYAN